MTDDPPPADRAQPDPPARRSSDRAQPDPRSRESWSDRAPDRREPGGPTTAGAASLVALLASTAAFDAVVAVAVRYLPEFLRSLGVGAPLIGAFGSVWLAGRLSGRLPGTGRTETVAGRTLLGAAVAAGGLALVTLVPALTGLSALGAWTLVLAGALGLAAWSRAGPLDRRVRWSLADTWGATSQLAWLIAALVAVTTVLALADAFTDGFRIVTALAAALGAAVAGLWAVHHGDVSPVGQRVDRRTARVPGETPLQFALAMVAVFVVVAVTSVVELDATVLEWHLQPATVFGVLLAGELVAARVAARLAPALVDAVGPRPVLVYAGLVASAFPLAVISAPSNPLVVGAVFVAFGTRSVGPVAGRRLSEFAGYSDDELVLTGVPRALAIAAGPFVAGLLYALSPVLAFGTATAVGAVGVWELARATGDGPGDNP